jgi:hypothetical protein
MHELLAGRALHLEHVLQRPLATVAALAERDGRTARPPQAQHAGRRPAARRDAASTGRPGARAHALQRAGLWQPGVHGPGLTASRVGRRQAALARERRGARGRLLLLRQRGRGQHARQAVAQAAGAAPS